MKAKPKSGQLYLAISDTDVTRCWILVYPTFIRLTVQFKENETYGTYEAYNDRRKRFIDPEENTVVLR